MDRLPVAAAVEGTQGQYEQRTTAAEQRETLESGLRLLARLIVRAQLRQQAASAAREDASRGGLSGDEGTCDT